MSYFFFSFSLKSFKIAFIYYFIFLSLAVLGLHCCKGFSLDVVPQFLTAVASLDTEHRLSDTQASVVVACDKLGFFFFNNFPSQLEIFPSSNWMMMKAIVSTICCILTMNRGGNIYITYITYICYICVSVCDFIYISRCTSHVRHYPHFTGEDYWGTTRWSCFI